MYHENDKHCKECICPHCSLFETVDCIEYPNLCSECNNEWHTVGCPFEGGGE